MQNRITEKIKLLNDKGQLANPGYATELLFEYNRENIKANKLRVKEWDYYYINNDKYALCLTIADNSYMALASVSFIDFEQKQDTTVTKMKFFSMGKTGLPLTSQKGDVEINLKGISIKFTNNGTSRNLTCECKNFIDKRTLYANVTLRDFPKESMVIATPFPGDKKAFYYNQKINCMPTDGEVKIGEELYTLEKSTTLGTLDWGRGVWTYKNTWYWGSLSTILPNGDLFGFNIGYGFGDTSNATENMLFLNGKAHKLSEVFFDIPQLDGKDDFMSPWVFSSDDGRFEMEFKPLLNRHSSTNLGILCSIQNQVFGYFSGKAILDNDEVVELNNAMGFAEKVYNKW